MIYVKYPDNNREYQAYITRQWNSVCFSLEVVCNGMRKLSKMICRDTNNNPIYDMGEYVKGTDYEKFLIRLNRPMD